MQVQKAIELVRSVMASGPGGGPAPTQQPGGGGQVGSYSFLRFHFLVGTCVRDKSDDVVLPFKVYGISLQCHINGDTRYLLLL